MSIVDAHPHIYSPDRDRYPTVPEPWEPGEPASAENLKARMDVVGVDRAIFIQTGTFYGFDNQYVMDSAKANAEWACGVVTLDPDDKSQLDALDEAVSDYNIRGLRGVPDSTGLIWSPPVLNLWSKAMALGIPVNCMVMDDLDRVPEIERIARELEDLKIVIDHCFMLNTRNQTEATLEALERLSELPNIYAKLTCGAHGSYRVYPHPDMHGPLKRVIDAFTPDRCVWGSNFPNALWSPGATYAQNLHLFIRELGLDLPDKAAILGGTALNLWFADALAAEIAAANESQERARVEAAAAVEEEEAADEVQEPTAEEARKRKVDNVTQLIIDGRAGDLSEPEPGGDTDDGQRANGAGQIEPEEAKALLDVASQLESLLEIIGDQPAGSGRGGGPAGDIVVLDTGDGLDKESGSGDAEHEESVGDGVDDAVDAAEINVGEEMKKSVAALLDESAVEEPAEDGPEVAPDAMPDVEKLPAAAADSPEADAADTLDDPAAPEEPGDLDTVDISQLIDQQNYTPLEPENLGKPSEEEDPASDDVRAAAEAKPLLAGQGIQDTVSETDAPEIDVDDLLAEAVSETAEDEPPQNGAGPDGPPATETISVEQLLAQQSAPQPPPEPSAEPAETPGVVDIEKLLAEQSAPPPPEQAAGRNGVAEREADGQAGIDQMLAQLNAENGTDDSPALDPGASSADDDPVDPSALDDVAAQLNSMLSLINDTVDTETSAGEDEEPGDSRAAS